MVSLVSGELPVSNGRSPILFKESWPRFHSLCRLYSTFELHCSLATRSPLGLVFKMIGTFRSDYDYEYEYEFFNVYPVRMPDCVRLSRQLVLSSKSRRRLDANYEIFNKSRPPDYEFTTGAKAS